MFKGSRGLALISVLWVTTLLAVMAAGLTSSTRTERILARNQLENAKAEALADAGVYRAVLGLLDLDPETGWRGDGTIYQIELPGGVARIAIEDEEAKIDLNTAPLELVAGLFRAVGIEEEQAAMLADRLGDFRDPDDEMLPLGAEDADYAEAGRARGAKDGPLVAKSELLQVLGVTPELYERVRRHVTVFSGSEGIDPLRASRTVLAAVPGMAPDMIDAFANARLEDDPFALIEDEEALLDAELYFLFSREIVYTVRAEGRTRGGAVFVREAVVELAADVDRPFRIYAWDRDIGA
jgi:general secretion pathway protein K